MVRIRKRNKILKNNLSVLLFSNENFLGKENVVVFDFLGKDSIRYYNEVPVEKRVFKNLLLFKENKQPQDDLFDRLNVSRFFLKRISFRFLGSITQCILNYLQTTVLNKHLNELMEGLTAKVFRTYNASWTLQEQLNELTNPDDTEAEKVSSLRFSSYIRYKLKTFPVFIFGICRFFCF